MYVTKKMVHKMTLIAYQSLIFSGVVLLNSKTHWQKAIKLIDMKPNNFFAIFIHVFSAFYL